MTQTQQERIIELVYLMKQETDAEKLGKLIDELVNVIEWRAKE